MASELRDERRFSVTEIERMMHMAAGRWLDASDAVVEWVVEDNQVAGAVVYRKVNTKYPLGKLSSILDLAAEDDNVGL